MVGAGRAKRYSARAPSWLIDQGTSSSSRVACTPAVKSVARADHVLERLLGEHLAEGGPHGSGREGVARQGASDAADVDDVGIARLRCRVMAAATSRLMP